MTPADLLDLARVTSIRLVPSCPLTAWRVDVHPALYGAEARPWRDELARLLHLEAAAVVVSEGALWVVGAARSPGRAVRWYTGRCP